MTTSSADDDGWADSAHEELATGARIEFDSDPVIDPDIEPDADPAEPARWARPDATGVPSVDAAIETLGELDQLPTSEHVAVYEGLHRQLQDALADLDGA